MEARDTFFSLAVIMIFSTLAIGGAAAHYCPINDRIIFRLSDAANAHGEMAYYPDGTNVTKNYDHEICWYRPVDLDIQQRYPMDNGANCVINLSSITDAHGQDPDNYSGGTYDENFQVCYGDIECISCDARNTECNASIIGPSNYFCPDEFSCVVQLSNWTNAHMRACINTDTDYPIARCCRPTSPPSGPECGNAILEEGEECDAGYVINNDPASFCDPTCHRRFCTPI